MSNLFVIAYPGTDGARHVIDLARRLEAGHLVRLLDAVYATRDSGGALSIVYPENRTDTLAARDTYWSNILGQLLDDQPAHFVGAVDSLVGKLAYDSDIDPIFVRDMVRHLAPGGSFAFLLTSDGVPDKVIPEIGKFGGTVLHTSLKGELEARLQRELDAAHRKAQELARLERELGCEQAGSPTLSARDHPVNH
jgi:uncharacterized membrane protein